MKRIIFIIAIIAGIALMSSGKAVRRTLNILMNSVPETETLANETMEFVYDYSCCIDTTGSLEENFINENMLLQIGTDGLSKFSSYKNLTIDSLIMRSTSEQLIQAAQSGRLNNGDFMTIYKNYPAGKLTHTEKICQDWFCYEEAMPVMEWELTDTTVNILGYDCQGARCNFRGREWLAFFAEEIPIAEGPWKLYGLPGLIMKASDSTGEYSFECVGIKSKADRPITIYQVPFNKVKRKDYYDAKHRYEINPYAYAESTAGIHIRVTDEAGNPSLDAYDPIELSYDFLELDWRK